MSKVKLAVLLFLVLGAVLIYQETSATGDSFTHAFWNWLKQLGTNIKSVTGFAVKEHDWIPQNVTEEDHGN